MSGLPTLAKRADLQTSQHPTRFRGTILLVDDDRHSIDSLSRWLDNEGYETRSTFHPLHGLIIAAEHKIDAAVVDINLPDVNGLAFLQQLVQLDLFPVIVHTRGADPDLFRMANELGATECLSKPASVDDLKVSIDRAISRH